MTHQQVDSRIKTFSKALRSGQITAQEWEALMTALTQIARK